MLSKTNQVVRMSRSATNHNEVMRSPSWLGRTSPTIPATMTTKTAAFKDHDSSVPGGSSHSQPSKAQYHSPDEYSSSS